MSGINEWPITAEAVLFCDRRTCAADWKSEPYQSRTWDDLLRAAQPAFEAGWRIYSGERQQYTYCPEHGPTVPMRLVHGAAS